MRIHYDSKCRIVMFDLDDTLWPLSRRVAKYVGVPYGKLNNFHTMQNTELTIEQRRAVIEAYRTPQIFEDMNFFPGAERIFELEQYGLLVQISTNSFTEEIRDIKLHQLLRKYPGIAADKLHLNIVDEHSTLHGKHTDENVFCLVDDGPYNIAKSQARHNLVPIAPWNATWSARQLMKGVPYDFCAPDDVDSIIKCIITLVEDERRFFGKIPT